MRHFDHTSTEVPHLLTPERAIQLQVGFGSTIIMQLDHVVGYPAEPAQYRVAMDRSGRWLQRCIDEFHLLDAGRVGTRCSVSRRGAWMPKIASKARSWLPSQTLQVARLAGSVLVNPRT